MSSSVNGTALTASMKKTSQKSEEKPQEHAKIQTHTQEANHAQQKSIHPPNVEKKQAQEVADHTKILSENSLLWEKRMDKQLSQYNSNMHSLEDKLARDLLAIKSKGDSQKQSKNKKFTLKMDALNKKQETLAQMHEKEVLDIFEDHKTQDFIS